MNNSSSPYYEQGIDVSHWQGEIDWKIVAKKQPFLKHVIMKMTEGGDYVDPMFKKNWEGANAVGLTTHVYHYFCGKSSTPEEQFNNIARMLNSVVFDWKKNRFAFDVEETGNKDVTPDEMSDNLFALIQKVVVLNPYRDEIYPLLYFSQSYGQTSVSWERHAEEFLKHPLWMARWNNKGLEPIVPDLWKNAGMSWSIWQYSSTGQIEGITGDVDLDRVKPGSALPRSYWAILWGYIKKFFCSIFPCR